MYRKSPKTYKYGLYAHRFWRWNNWQCYAFVILGIFLFFPIFRYVKSQLAKNQELNDEIQNDKSYLQNQNPEVAQTKADGITQRKDIQQAAKEIAHHLGTKYSDTNIWYDFLDPRGWTENDKAIADILIYQRNNYAYIKKLYTKVYSNNRDLSQDLIEKLDQSEMNRVQKYISI